jgi:hypothetical protein
MPQVEVPTERNKDLKFRTTEEVFDHARFSSYPFYGTAEFPAQMANIEAAQVPEFDPLQLMTMRPDTSRSKCCKKAMTSSELMAQS